MLDRADKILRTGSVQEIRDFLPELIQAYITIDIEAVKQAKQFEIARIEKYVELKKEKKSKWNSYSDKDIDYLSKNYALQKYWDYELNKKIASHYRLYIDELRNQIIQLNVLNKAMRESLPD